MADPVKTTYGDAVTRFTRTPVEFPIYNDILEWLKDAGALDKNYQPTEVSGGYFDNQKKIKINLPSSNTPYFDVASAIGHEDIHAALDKAGLGVAPDSSSKDYSSFANYFNTLLRDPVKLAAKLFHEKNRSGILRDELPAYVGATPYILGPEFTEADRQHYINQFTSVLPNKVAELYRRIAQNYTGSLKSPFVVQAPK